MKFKTNSITSTTALTSVSLVAATAVSALAWASAAQAQYGTRGSSDGLSTVVPIFQQGAQDLSTPPGLNGAQPVQQFQPQQFQQFQPQQIQPVQQFNQVQPIQVLPVQNVGPATNARGVVLGGGAGTITSGPIPVVPTSSGTAVVTSGQVGVNQFTGETLPGQGFVGVPTDLPLVTEDYVNLDLNGVITPGSIGRVAEFVASGAVETSSAGAGFSSGGSTISAGPIGTSTASAGTSSSSAASSQLVGAIRPGVSIPRPERKPAQPSTAVARRTVSTTRPTTSTTAAATTAAAQAPAATRSVAVRTAPRTELVPGDALGLRQTPNTAQNQQVASAQPQSQVVREPATPTAAQTETAAAAPKAPAPDPRLLKILFDQESASLPQGAREALTLLANTMKQREDVRIQLLSYASLPNQGSTEARRLSLSRALAVRVFLISQGVTDSRILVRAEGDRNAGSEPDRIDIIRID